MPKSERHVPTDATRVIVDFVASVGAPQTSIARMLGIDKSTLRRHYAAELEGGGWAAKAQLAKNAFQIAMDRKHPKEASAMTMFLCKTRLGWRETDRHEQVIMSPDGTLPELKTVVILPSNGREIPMIAPPVVPRQAGRPRKDSVN